MVSDSPYSGWSRSWSPGIVRSKERESVVLKLALPCKTGNQHRTGFNPTQSEGDLMPDNAKHPAWSQFLLASGHTQHGMTGRVCSLEELAAKGERMVWYYS